MNSNMLPESTRKLWETITEDNKRNRDLNGFVLVGGTALTLRIGHRISEDLDFLWVCGDTLPRQRIEKFINRMYHENRLPVEPVRHIGAENDFLDAGLDMLDYQQDFLISGVRVTFFTPDPEHHVEKWMQAGDSDNLRVASVAEIFRLKSLVVLNRVSARDIFDLYTMVAVHSCSLQDAKEYISQSGIDNSYNWEVFSRRLIEMRVPEYAEEIRRLAGESYPPFEELQKFFLQKIAEINSYEKKPGRETPSLS
jgi:predicted nucleotidyltransferase component of viral defense system